MKNEIISDISMYRAWNDLLRKFMKEWKLMDGTEMVAWNGQAMDWNESSRYI